MRFSGATEPIIMLDPEGSEDSIVRSSAPDYGFGDEGKSEVVHIAPPHLAASIRLHCEIIIVIANYNDISVLTSLQQTRLV